MADDESPRGSVWIENLTGMEAEEALREFEVVMIPLGARDQGAWLPPPHEQRLDNGGVPRQTGRG